MPTRWTAKTWTLVAAVLGSSMVFLDSAVLGVALPILPTNFGGAEQGRAFGVWAAASALAPIIGPFVGGLLVDTLSWRWVFLLNLPFAAVAVWAALRYMKESRDEQASGRFDWLG